MIPSTYAERHFYAAAAPLIQVGQGEHCTYSPQVYIIQKVTLDYKNRLSEYFIVYINSKNLAMIYA